LSNVNLEGDLGEAGVCSNGTRWFLAAADAAGGVTRVGSAGCCYGLVWQRRTAVDGPVAAAAAGDCALDGGEEAGWARRVMLRPTLLVFGRGRGCRPAALYHPVPIRILKARGREPSRRCRFLYILLFFFN
jgi:hypothetical protein